MNELSLFTGMAAFTLGLRLAGIQSKVVMYVENEPYCQEIIKARIKDGFLDNAPIWDDVRTFRGEQFRGLVDIVTAGFPCQPHSTAGKRKGESDERNLWPDTLKIIRDVGPRYVLLENVPGLLQSSGGSAAYGGTVLGQLAEAGYVCQWDHVRAHDIGAPHRRERWWCLAIANSNVEDSSSAGTRDKSREAGGGIGSQDVRQRNGKAGPIRADSASADVANSPGESSHRSQSRDSEGTPGEREFRGFGIFPPGPSDGEAWGIILEGNPSLEPAVRGVANGTPHRVDRLKALGNGIVSAVVAEFLRRIA